MSKQIEHFSYTDADIFIKNKTSNDSEMFFGTAGKVVVKETTNSILSANYGLLGEYSFCDIIIYNLENNETVDVIRKKDFSLIIRKNGNILFRKDDLHLNNVDMSSGYKTLYVASDR